MKDELRKVLFNLNEQCLSFGDLEYDDPDGILQERRGFFYRLGDVVIYDPESGKNFQKTVAIIEEEETGKVFAVAIGHFEFTESLKSSK